MPHHDDDESPLHVQRIADELIITVTDAAGSTAISMPIPEGVHELLEAIRAEAQIGIATNEREFVVQWLLQRESDARGLSREAKTHADRVFWRELADDRQALAAAVERGEHL